MKVYIRDWGRPMGVEPQIFTHKCKATIEDPNNEMQFVPEVVEFENIRKALEYLLHYCDTNTLSTMLNITRTKRGE